MRKVRNFWSTNSYVFWVLACFCNILSINKTSWYSIIISVYYGWRSDVHQFSWHIPTIHRYRDFVIIIFYFWNILIKQFMVNLTIFFFKGTKCYHFNWLMIFFKPWGYSFKSNISCSFLGIFIHSCWYATKSNRFHIKVQYFLQNVFITVLQFLSIHIHVMFFSTIWSNCMKHISKFSF